MPEFQGLIQKIHINKFRKFKNLEIKCGNHLTIIAGQNGTQKTTLLGLLAHPFSMSKKDPEDDNTLDDTDFTNSFYEFRTINGQKFQSKFARKFKLDPKLEKAGDHEYTLFLTNHNLGKDGKFTLESILRDRKNSSLRLWKKKARNAGDGYMPYPVIYLSLKRVSPIGEEKTIKSTPPNLSADEQEFLYKCYKEILLSPFGEYESNQLKSSNKSTLVAHPKDYGALTISAGQDNLGSILTAILSFKRLKDTFPTEYKGGLLFIDEIESTLYPASQEQLLKHLLKFSSDLNLQIFCTTHSLTVLTAALKVPYSYHCNVNYLKLSNDNIVVENNLTVDQITAHLTLNPLSSPPTKKIRVYTEDSEARLFIKTLLPRRLLSRIELVDVSLGAEELIKLKKSKIPEFTENLIILDGDKSKHSINNKNVITLPSNVGPDQLLFEFLNGLPDDDEFWPDTHTTGSYSKQICFKTYHTPTSSTKGELRTFYKNWFKEQSENKYWGERKLSAFKHWCTCNPNEKDAFNTKFIDTFNYIAKKKKIPLIE